MRRFPIRVVAVTVGLSLLSSLALAAGTPSDDRKAYQAAIKSMRQAEEQINKTGEDPSGHKTQALEALRQAIGQADAAQANVANKP